MLSVLLDWVDLQGREDQLFSELEARYGPAKKAAAAAPAQTAGKRPKAAAPGRVLYYGVMCVESAGKYFSQENPVIREITQRVQAMWD